MKPGATRMCILPFTTPSVEPDGTVRLCSAASTYAYLDETNMGNYREAGLAAVWNNSRFRQIRQSLLSGAGLKPFCESCEYRHEGPPWMLQFHLALYGHNQTGSESFLPIIERHRERYEEYCRIAAQLGLWVEPMPAPPKDESSWIYRLKPLVPPAIRFQAEGEWTDITLPIAALDVEQLVQIPESRIVVRCRGNHIVAGDLLNLRVSLEDGEGKLAYYFPHFNESEGVLSFAGSSLQSEKGTGFPRKASQIRVGGFGPVGTSLTIDSIEVSMGPQLTEACSELADQRLRGEQEHLRSAQLEDQLRQVSGRLSELDHRVEPLRRVFRLLPRRLRDVLKNVL